MHMPWFVCCEHVMWSDMRRGSLTPRLPLAAHFRARWHLEGEREGRLRWVMTSYAERGYDAPTPQRCPRPEYMYIALH